MVENESNDKDVYADDTDFGDMDGLGNVDIKINPDFYIHTAIIRAQKCLMKDDMKSGFIQYVVFINHIENLCFAARKLDDDYTTKIRVFAEDLQRNPDKSHPDANSLKIADYKMRLITEAVFNNKTLTDALKTS